MQKISTFLIGFALALSSAWVAAEPVNPFSRPAIGANVAGAELALNADAQPELRGVIVAGSGSIANVSGTLLSIGEEVAGYRLESVTESSATFLHDEKKVMLHLEDPAEEKE